MAEKIILAVDLGGTKTNLALYSNSKGLGTPINDASLPTAKYNDFESLLRDFLSGSGKIRIEAASLGVAGPVLGDQAEITSLPWKIDAGRLKKVLGVQFIRLMNDLVATAEALPHLNSADLHVVAATPEDARGPKAVLAPGTGLGQAYLTWDGNGYRAFPSEGGHVDFAPADHLQIGFFEYLQKRYGHVSYERVCSGRGMPDLYEYLKSAGYGDESKEFRVELEAVADPTPLIVHRALDYNDSNLLCRKTLEVFVAILGSAAGNVALNFLATGGVYLGGGMPPKIIDAIDSENFRNAFRQKGRMSNVLERIPVFIVLNPKTALLGAAAYGFKMVGS